MEEMKPYDRGKETSATKTHRAEFETEFLWHMN